MRTRGRSGWNPWRRIRWRSKHTRHICRSTEKNGAFLSIRLPEKTAAQDTGGCGAHKTGDRHFAGQRACLRRDGGTPFGRTGGRVAKAARRDPRDRPRAGADAGAESACVRPFYRADESRREKQHFGLGLSIASELVSLNKGVLDVIDTPGGGCTFRIGLRVTDLVKLSKKTGFLTARRTKNRAPFLL